MGIRRGHPIEYQATSDYISLSYPEYNFLSTPSFFGFDPRIVTVSDPTRFKPLCATLLAMLSPPNTVESPLDADTLTDFVRPLSYPLLPQLVLAENFADLSAFIFNVASGQPLFAPDVLMYLSPGPLAAGGAVSFDEAMDQAKALAILVVDAQWAITFPSAIKIGTLITRFQNTDAAPGENVVNVSAMTCGYTPP